MTAHSFTGLRVSRRDLLTTGIASTFAAMPLAALAGEEAKITVEPYDKVKPQEFPWGWIRWLMNSEIDSDAEMTLGIVHIEANQSNPFHLHPNCTEYVHIISGSSEHYAAGRWVTLKEGDTLRIPKGAEHRARTKDQPCRAIIVYDTGTRQMVTLEEGGKPK